MIASFCQQQRAWLELELQSEQKQEKKQQNSNSGNHAERSNANVLTGLEVDDVSIGLYGRTVLRFVPFAAAVSELAAETTDESTSNGNDIGNGTGSTRTRLPVGANTGSSTSQRHVSLLPAHRFTTGDEVEIRSNGCANGSASSSHTKSTPRTGVVSAVTDSSLAIALYPAQRSVRKGGKSKQDDDDHEEDADFGDFSNPPYALLARSNVEVHNKILKALTELETKGMDHPACASIIRALFDPNTITRNRRYADGDADADAPAGDAKTTPTTTPTTTPGPIHPNLDQSQTEAIAFALSSNQPIALIHGPPGTGKTTTLAELIRQAVHEHGYKVLVTAPSNVAVDNLLSRLVAVSSDRDNKAKRRSRRDVKPRSTTTDPSSSNTSHPPPLNAVRLGHPARLQPAILPYCLEARVQSADGTEIVQDVRSELQAHLATLSRSRPALSSRSSKPSREKIDKRLAYTEVKALRKELRVREEKVVKEILAQAQVVLATCVGAANTKLLSTLEFDLVVIDEAAQALEAACWIPVLQARRKLVLAGDHLQLPPTIKSNIPAVQAGLGQTMFERVMKLYGDDSGQQTGRVSRMLKVQYRMNELIADWASQALYGGELTTHETVKSRTLAQLVEGSAVASKPVADMMNTDEDEAPPPFLLLDTAGCHMYESTNAAGSRYNEGEARLVVQHVRKLLAMGVEPEQIAVITPYNGQVEVLRLALLPEAPKLQIRSVDGFQGGEREAVVLSLVRSSRRGGLEGIGFLRDDRRLNVAVTRAKRHCCLVCDTETVSQSIFIKNLIHWIEEHGEQKSAVELCDGDENDFGSPMEADLRNAEFELDRLLSQSKKATAADPADVYKRRSALQETICSFQTKSVTGDVLWMSSELSKLDRKLVHQIAEELGLEHQSEGLEGVDRRIKLTISSNAQPSLSSKSQQLETPTPIPDRSNDEEQRPSPTNPVSSEFPVGNGPGYASADEASVSIDEQVHPISRTAFAASEVELEDDTDLVHEIEPDNNNKPDSGLTSVLGSLALERAERERKKQQERSMEKPKPKPKKSQKLGGTKKPISIPVTGEGLDDMAFLDAQIDKVQNSHGRQVEGKGKAYRTIVNGVLLAKPAAPLKARNDKATTALNAKLREAMDGRKAKTKK